MTKLYLSAHETTTASTFTNKDRTISIDILPQLGEDFAAYSRKIACDETSKPQNFTSVTQALNICNFTGCQAIHDLRCDGETLILCKNIISVGLSNNGCTYKRKSEGKESIM